MERSFLPKGHHELSDAAAAVGNCDCANTLRFSAQSAARGRTERSVRTASHTPPTTDLAGKQARGVPAGRDTRGALNLPDVK